MLCAPLWPARSLYLNEFVQQLRIIGIALLDDGNFCFGDIGEPFSARLYYIVFSPNHGSEVRSHYNPTLICYWWPLDIFGRSISCRKRWLNFNFCMMIDKIIDFFRIVFWHWKYFALHVLYYIMLVLFRCTVSWLKIKKAPMHFQQMHNKLSILFKNKKSNLGYK